MRIFSAHSLPLKSLRSVHSFEPDKSYKILSESEILTPAPGTCIHIEKKLFMNMLHVFYCFSSYLFSIPNRSYWYQNKAEGKPVIWV